MDDMLSNSRILSAYRARTPGSAELAREAATLFPSGVTHDSRHLEPYGVYVQRAQGPHKWDVDGNKYVDFYGGHGALLLGHGHPAVTAAVAAALADGTHFGASHPRELAWARALQILVPSAERVRFTSSGTEATLMAVRLARAFTGRPVLLRFQGHFHGWHDHMAAGYTSHFDGSATPGVLAEVAAHSILVPPNDLPALKAALARGDVAAAILEPTGSSFGQVPIDAEFLRELRRLTEEAGTLLIMDEVVSGFRATKGGAQGAYGVRPDLSSYAKILAGGLPGAAVAGRREGENPAPGHVQRQPSLGGGWHRRVDGDRRDGCVGAGFLHRGVPARGREHGVRRGRGGLGHVRHVLRLPHVPRRAGRDREAGGVRGGDAADAGPEV
jgi:glutamate-1-semialdehyde 2,1-aminomutase